MKRTEILTKLAIIIGIIFIINFISSKLFFRLDFTADKRYTLSKVTKDILQGLNDVVTVKAYYSEDLPTQLSQTRKDFREQLIEYEHLSKGKVVYEFINPNENEQAEMQAQQAGIGPIIVNVTKRDKVEQMRAYMGAMIQMGERKEIIPVIQPGFAMEYALTTAIKKLSILQKPKVAFLQGHGEPSKNSSLQVVEQLSVLYDVEDYAINDTLDIPTEYKAIAIINPTDTFPPDHLNKLDKYMSSGGGLYIALSRVKGDLNTSMLRKGDSLGLENWLSKKGVTIEEDFLTDINCGAVTAMQNLGAFTLPVQIKFPYFPMIGNFADHLITEGIESLFLPFVSSISYSSGDTNIRMIPLAKTSEKSGQVIPPAYIDVRKNWQESDFPFSSLTVAVAVKGKIIGNIQSKMVVIANGSFAINGEGRQQQQV
ncbi:MAG: GldG family protein, partial [Bacteroidetes bacterium]|nr:GldG family protein [Bacteroidota bacterium]